MPLSRRAPIIASNATLAGMTIAQITRAQDKAGKRWPDQLLEKPLREGFPVPLPLNVIRPGDIVIMDNLGSHKGKGGAPGHSRNRR